MCYFVRNMLNFKEMITVKEKQLLLKHWSLFTNPLNMLSMMFLFPFKCNNLHSQKESVQSFYYTVSDDG